MLNEYAYCPRLYHLMHVEGRWEDNVYTSEGRHVHRRVDQLDHVLPYPDRGEDRTASSEQTDDDEPPKVSRSVPLASERLGLTAKLDLVSTAAPTPFPSRRSAAAFRRIQTDHGARARSTDGAGSLAARVRLRM